MTLGHWSLPLRECGLKCQWIEQEDKLVIVTPLAGVWIEINIKNKKGDIKKSLPLRECGLKYLTAQNCTCKPMSLPLRECGLKSKRLPAHGGQLLSLPLRECGLKLWLVRHRKKKYSVTPLAGVWIEMSIVSPLYMADITSLPLRECGLKLLRKTKSKCRSTSLPLRECGLKYWIPLLLLMGYQSLPLRECGLKSHLTHLIYKLVNVTPLAGVWIEILPASQDSSSRRSLPLRECGLKSWLSYTAIFAPRHSPCGSVDWNLDYSAG